MSAKLNKKKLNFKIILNWVKPVKCDLNSKFY